MRMISMLGDELRRGPAPLLCALLAFGGTALAFSAHADDKVKVKGDIAVSAEVNPDRNKRPSPIVLVMFQLKSADAFNNADFFSLYAPDAAIVAGDLVSRTQMTLQPGEARPIEAEFDEAARFVGVIAAYRDIDNAQWRGIVALPEKGFFKKFFSRSKLKIQVDPLAVAVSFE
jgi:type VI secretion system protein VasD